MARPTGPAPTTTTGWRSTPIASLPDFVTYETFTAIVGTERAAGQWIPAPQTEAEAGGEALILGAFLPYRISTLAESVSRGAIRLADKRLIIRVTQPGDQRALRLRRSRRGVAMYRQIVPYAHILQNSLLQALSPAELRVLDATLAQLLAHADALAGDGPA